MSTPSLPECPGHPGTDHVSFDNRGRSDKEIASPVCGKIVCDSCHEPHVAEFAHESVHGQGAIYVVICTVDYLADYYTAERIVR